MDTITRRVVLGAACVEISLSGVALLLGLPSTAMLGGAAGLVLVLVYQFIK